MGDLELARHLPVLVVILPLFGGLLSIFTYRGVLPWLWATLVMGVTFVASLQLLHLVQTSPDGVINYYLGWWPAEYGIAYRVDALNAYIIVTVAFIAFISTLYAGRSVADEIPADRHNLFYAVWMLAVSGLIGITATGDTFNIYVLLEISSLTVYTLIAMGASRDRRALTASLKYLILGSIGATFILLGIGYLLMLTGTLNMADMHDALLEMKDRGELPNKTVLVGFAFLMVGLSLKMALFPLHLWLPNAYTYAPSAVTVLVASTATKVGVYMSFRFVFTIFGGVYDTEANLDLLALMACMGIVVSSLFAIRQTNVKKILAYSSVGQIAYIVLGFALANKAGVTASIIHIFNHAVIKGGMFAAVGCVMLRVGGVRLDDFKGLGRKMPITMAAFTAGGLGLIGVPGTAGFVSKWYLVKGCMDGGQWGVAAVVLVGGVLALVYVWRVVEVIYFGKPTPEQAERQEKIKEAPLSMLVPTWIFVAASIYFGLRAGFTANSAEAAAMLLLGGNG